MPFASGRVTFCRFLAVGNASTPPTVVDQELIDKLSEYAFTEQSIGAPDEVEAGWTTGQHLFDTQFTYEKNGFGHMLLFSMRVDTHKVPAEVKKAYKTMNEQAAAAGNPSGFASRIQKKEAAELAERQVHEDLVAGRFRKSKTVPILWDLSNKMVYAASAGNTVTEHLSRLFRETFDIALEPLSAGVMAGQTMRAQGKGRDYEDLMPSPFTPPPAAARLDQDDASPAPQMDLSIPPLPWIAKTIDAKDFLGNEFLIWLWYCCENEEGIVKIDSPTGGDDIAITIDKSLDMDCGWGVLGKQSLRGGGVTHYTEAGEALATGKWPRKAALIVADTADGQQWELTLQADRWIVSGAALPEVPDAESPRQIIESRLGSVTRMAWVLDGLYLAFLKQRTAGSWPSRRKTIRQWIHNRRPERTVVSFPAEPAQTA